MSHLFLSLYFFPGDSKKIKEGIEIQFLVDTGATVSLINNKKFQYINKLEKQKLEKPSKITRAVNNTILDMDDTSQFTL